jgi:probable lipoprotein (TIGR04455 family)
MKAILALALLTATALAAPGCGSVDALYVRDDYDRVDRSTLKRIAIIAVAAEDAPHDLPQLMAALAKKHIQQHTTYIVLKTARLETSAPAPADVTKLEERLDGALILRATRVSREDDEVEIAITARLVRARDGVEVWRAEGEDDFETADPDLEKLTTTYRRKYGDTADTFVAPLFLLLRDLFEDLPSPTLTDEDKDEKILLES